MQSLAPRRRAIAAILLVLAVAVGLSACGSSATSSSASAGGGTSGTQYQARLNLAKCFRAHGLNVPDPSTNGGPAGGGGGGGVLRALQGYPQAQITAATTACKQYMAAAFPRLNQTPAQQAQFRQQFVKFAECMRSHGINIPDPTTTGAGGFGLRGALRSIDRNSPAFQAANKACQSLRPRFGGAGGGGGPGAGGAAPGGAPGA
jgi:hypothetical protein